MKTLVTEPISSSTCGPSGWLPERDRCPVAWPAGVTTAKTRPGTAPPATDQLWVTLFYTNPGGDPKNPGDRHYIWSTAVASGNRWNDGRMARPDPAYRAVIIAAQSGHAVPVARGELVNPPKPDIDPTRNPKPSRDSELSPRIVPEIDRAPRRPPCRHRRRFDEWQTEAAVEMVIECPGNDGNIIVGKGDCGGIATVLMLGAGQ